MRITKRSARSIALLLAAACLCAGAPAGAEQEYDPDLTAETILRELDWRKGEELYQLIRFLHGTYDKSRLTDQQIDRIVARLRVIQENDTYRPVTEGKGGQTTLFVSRHEAASCIFRFRFQKIVNGLNRLPIAERVHGIIDLIENQPTGLGYGTTFTFARELVSAGWEAVPFIIQRRPERPYHRRALVWALAEIGDPGAIDYIVEVLETRDHSYRFERPVAARALGKFDDERVLSPLVNALQDDTQEPNGRRFCQSVDCDHEPLPAWLYSVHHAAAQSLKAVTEQDWGLFYGEDHRTWASWLESDHRETFSPAELERSDQEVARLVELMFHRYMSGRPNPDQPQNDLATPEGVHGLVADLKQLGKRVIPVLIDQCHARVDEFPAWDEELRPWTRELLLGLDWEEARAAAEKLAPTSSAPLTHR